MAAAIRVVEAAFPSFEAKLRGTPLFYRGSDELGRPGIRALMGAFAFRNDPSKGSPEGLGKRKQEIRNQFARDAAKQALGCRGVIVEAEEPRKTDDLSAVISGGDA